MNEAQTKSNPKCNWRPNRLSPDPHALAAAKAAQAAVTPDLVILFGSRARGDHHKESDLDLMVIGHNSSAGAAAKAARDYFQDNPPTIEVETFPYSNKEFAKYRKAAQHIVGQAARHGFFMSNERNEHRPNYDDDYDEDYPEHWPATRQRLENTWKPIVGFNQDVDNGEWDQEMTGFKAHQSVENGLRAVLSVRQCPRDFRHDLIGIWNHYQQNHHDPQDTALKNAMDELLDYTSVRDPNQPGQTTNWLTSYAAKYRYSNAPRRIAPWEWNELRYRVNDAVEELISAAHRMSGTSDEDLFQDGKPWERT